MNIALLVRDYVKKHELREPIFVKDLKVANKNARNVAFYRLKKLGKIKSYKKGIYYKPEITPFGELGIDKNKLIGDLYLKRKNEIIGYVTGPILWNMWGITTQVSNKKWIVTNVVNRNIELTDLNVKLLKSKYKVTKENYKLMQVLDLIEQKDLIQDINFKFYEEMLKSKINTLSIEETKLLKEISKYYSNNVINYIESTIK